MDVQRAVVVVLAAAAALGVDVRAAAGQEQPDPPKEPGDERSGDDKPGDEGEQPKPPPKPMTLEQAVATLLAQEVDIEFPPERLTLPRYKALFAQMQEVQRLVTTPEGSKAAEAAGATRKHFRRVERFVMRYGAASSVRLVMALYGVIMPGGKADAPGVAQVATELRKALLVLDTPDGRVYGRQMGLEPDKIKAVQLSIEKYEQALAALRQKKTAGDK